MKPVPEIEAALAAAFARRTAAARAQPFDAVEFQNACDMVRAAQECVRLGSVLAEDNVPWPEAANPMIKAADEHTAHVDACPACQTVDRCTVGMRLGREATRLATAYYESLEVLPA